MSRTTDAYSARSSFLEIAALQLATTSPSVAAVIQTERTRLQLSRGERKFGPNGTINACQACGHTMLPSLTDDFRDQRTKMMLKGPAQQVILITCAKCGAKTRQQVTLKDRTKRELDDKTSRSRTFVVEAMKPGPEHIPAQLLGSKQTSTITRRAPAKKAKSLRAQLAQANITSRTSTASSGPGLGLMDFLKKA